MAVRLLYEREDGLWAWNLAANNGKIIATDGGRATRTKMTPVPWPIASIGGEFKDAEKRIRRRKQK